MKERRRYLYKYMNMTRSGIVKDSGSIVPFLSGGRGEYWSLPGDIFGDLELRTYVDMAACPPQG